MKIAELKAHLSRAVKAVKQGEVITIYERDTPVAQIVPLAENKKAQLTRPEKGAKPFKAVDSTLGVDFDPIAGLVAERQRR